MPDPQFQKYLSDNGRQMVNILMIVLGSHCYLYQFDYMCALKLADSLLQNDGIK